jgi:HSP20 family protein
MEVLTMAIQRSDAFQEMLSLREAMSQLFEQSLVRPTSTTGRTSGLSMDVYAEDDHYVVEMAIPGVDPRTVDLSVHDNELTVCGEFREREEPQDARQGTSPQQGRTGGDTCSGSWPRAASSGL